MTVRLYSYDDVGAPSHSGTGLGQMLNILRACLVTGYGTRTGAGWTIPFSDLPNNKAVFRGQSGVGDYFRVDDNLNYEYCTITGYETMSDLDIGTEEYPKVGAGLDVTYWKQPHRDGTLATNDAWHVIASEEFCYVVTKASSSARGGFFFGQYEKAGDTVTVPNYCITGTNSSSISTSSIDRALTDTSSKFLAYQRRNKWDDINRTTGIIPDYHLITLDQPNPVDGKFYFSKIPIRGNTNSPYTFWGHMPNAVMFYGIIGGEAFSEDGTKMSIDGSPHMVMKSNDSTWAFKYDVDVG